MVARGYYSIICLFYVSWCLFVRAAEDSATGDGLECMQTIYGPEEVYNKPLTTTIVQNYDPGEPSPSDAQVSLDPCSELSDSKLAFHWELNRSQATGQFGSKVMACLKMVQRNSRLTETLSCYNFSILSSERRSEIHCWADILSYDHLILVKAYIKVFGFVTTYTYYSEVHTLGIETLCNTTILVGPSVSRIHGCNTSGQFTLTPDTEVKAITAKGGNNMTWHLPYHQESGSRSISFTLSEDMNGPYNLTIVIYRSDVHVFISFVRKIYVFCSVERTSTPSAAAVTPNVQTPSDVNFLVFMFAGLVTFIVLAIFVLLVTGVMRISLRRDRRTNGCCPCRRHISDEVEMQALNNQQGTTGQAGHGALNHNNGRVWFPPQTKHPAQPAVPTQTPSSNTAGTDQSSIQTPLLPNREPSDQIRAVSSDFSGASLDINELRVLKEIIILPLSQDQYMQELTGCLEKLLSFQDRVTCKSIYDHQVMSEFNNDRHYWIHTLLQDDKCIALIPCSTSVNNRHREPTCMDEILEHFKLGLQAHPRCHLVFLNLSGIDYGPNGYVGETFMVRQEADCEGLVRHLFALCGFCMNRDVHLLREELGSENYARFLQVVLRQSNPNSPYVEMIS